MSMSFLNKKMYINALNLIYCKFVAQIIGIEDIDNITKGAVEVFSSVAAHFVLFSNFNVRICLIYIAEQRIHYLSSMF